MTIENDFLPFAAGLGANVLTQAQYAALPSLIANGFTAGVTPSIQVNKVWRQSSIMAAVLAQLIVAETGQPAIDDGTTATLLTNLQAAIAAISQQGGDVRYSPLAANIQFVSQSQTVKLPSHGMIEFNGGAASTITLPDPTQSTPVLTYVWNGSNSSQLTLAAAAGGFFGPGVPANGQSFVIPAGYGALICSDGRNYIVLSSCYTKSPPVGDSSALIPNTAWTNTAISSAVTAAINGLSMGQYATTTAVTNAIAGLNIGQYATNSAVSAAIAASAADRNLLINGNMDCWARGTVFNSPPNNTYTAERWLVGYDGTPGTFSVSRQSWAPGANPRQESQSYLSWNQSAAGSGDTVRQLMQRIESVRTGAGQPITVSFVAWADTARAITVQLTQLFGSGGGASPVITVSGPVNLTAVPAVYSVTLVNPGIGGKTIGGAGNDCLATVFNLPTNSVFTFNLGSVITEVGTVASAACRRLLAAEQALCRRYFQSTFPPFVAPAPGAGLLGAVFGRQITGQGGVSSIPWYFQTRMRAVPAITTYNPAAGNAQARNTDSGIDNSSTTAVQVSDSFALINYVASGATVAAAAAIHCTADAEL